MLYTLPYRLLYKLVSPLSNQLQSKGVYQVRQNIQYNILMLACGLLFALMVLPIHVAKAADESNQKAIAKLQKGQFEVQDIRLEGLQRVAVEIVFAALPIQVGDQVSLRQVSKSVQALYQTGNFEDIQVLMNEGVLIYRFSERSWITGLIIDGNGSIETDMLQEALAELGLSQGSVFKRATLDRIKIELDRQYVTQGRYGVEIDAEVEALPRNRVSIKININEGKVARIAKINLVGNVSFNDNELKENMELKEKHWLSWLKGDDKYSREKFSGDLERLVSFYQDKGYADFEVSSYQVTVSPDKSKVFLTINIDENKVKLIGKVSVKGDTKIPVEELEALLLVKQGQTFSRRLLTSTADLMTRKLGAEGYTFANVQPVPTPVEDTDQMDVVFYVNAGQRVYVRRINFYGNDKSKDEVLRREMRQMEGSWASGSLIEASKVRLERLGFFKTVKVETKPVVGKPDQIDVNYFVEEQPSGSVGASVGFQQGTGFVFGANLSQNNFFGTGNRVVMSLDRSDIRNNYNFSFRDPYFTVDGVSRGYNFYYQETEIDEDDVISSWSSDRYGGNINFSYPISDVERINFGIGYENITIFASEYSPLEVWDLVGYDRSLIPSGQRTQDADFNNYILNAGWSQSTLNRGIFPTAGGSQSLSLEASLPGSDLEYYKFKYSWQRFWPVHEQDWAIHLRSELGYGDGYSTTEELPFYEHYYAGGFGSIRGFENRSLGPRETQSPYDSDDPRAIGGNLLTEASLELIFPMPFVKDKRAFRSLVFFDAGNVFDTNRKDEPGNDIALDELRGAFGVGVSWLTAVGPLSFSLAKAINSDSEDDTQVFQFSLGQSF